MSNLLARIITCTLGIPLLYVIIFLIPQYNFLALSVVCILMSFLGSREMSRILYKKTTTLADSTWILPAFSYFACKYYTDRYIEILFALLIILVLSKHIFSGAKTDFQTSNEDISKDILLITYPSYLFTFVVRMLSLKNVNSYSVFLFLILVFANDIFAYVFGRLLGKNNKGVIKASPKKSLAGFIGGYLCCVALCVIYYKIFTTKLPALSFFGQILLGSGMSVLANLGDLVESVFKRSAGIKDSGSIIPGRGGILDSSDSIIACAPLFYFIFSIL